MIYRTRAIVLRTVKYGEASLIVDMFTEEKGHQTFIIHSVRKSKAVTPPSYLQLLSLVEMVGYHSDHKKIHHIKEVRIDQPYQSIPFDMRKSAVITCLAEIISKSVTTSYPQPELFHFLHEELLNYDTNPYDRDFFIRFLVSLSQFLGFGIELPVNGRSEQYLDLMEGTLTEKMPSHGYTMGPLELKNLKTIMTAGPTGKTDIPLEDRRRIVDQILLYYQLHVETLKEINAVNILREIL